MRQHERVDAIRQTQGQSLEDAVLCTSIQPDEIVYLVRQMTRLHEEGETPDFYSQAAILESRYPKGDVRPACIMERMRCLMMVMADLRMRNWSMDVDDPDCNLTQDAVFAAAAKAPLHREGARMRFFADEFFDVLLRETPAEGLA